MRDAIASFCRRSRLQAETEMPVSWMRPGEQRSNAQTQPRMDVYIAGSFPTRRLLVDVTIRAVNSATRYSSSSHADSVVTREKRFAYDSTVTPFALTARGRFLPSAIDACSSIVALAREN